MNEFDVNDKQQDVNEQNTITLDKQNTITPDNYNTEQVVYVSETNIPNESKGMAIASMILGIVSLLCACCWYIGIPCAIVGLILGIISLSKKKAGKGMALTGVILSGIALLLGVVVLFLAIGIASSGMTDFMNEFNDSFDFGNLYDI